MSIFKLQDNMLQDTLKFVFSFSFSLLREYQRSNHAINETRMHDLELARCYPKCSDVR